ncbi:MAG TPA: helix-turn-helix domain-containing protein [Tissierellaceae bacterium]
MANFNYKPWTNLMDQIGKFYGKAMTHNHAKSKNEYIIVVNAIHSMLMEKEQLERDIIKSKGYITKYILQNLCLGKNVTMEINTKALFPYKLYGVLIVDMDDRVQLVSKLERFLIKMVGMYFDDSLIYIFEDEKGRLCIVLNTASYGITLIVEVVRRLRDLISMHFDMPLYVGIGSIYEDISMLYNSYKEAKKALEYCLLKGRDCVVFYPDINKYIFASINLPIYSDNPLLNSVKIGDIKNCVKLLDEYFKNIGGDGVASIQYMYCLFYNFVSVIIKACEELNVSFKEVFNQTPEQILDIDRYRNPKQIINGIYDIYTTMCDYIQRNKKSQNNNLKKQIEDYILDNYTNKGLSLVEMADRLGYSSSYLSRFINQEFGIGFGELLNKVRIEHAKRLLASELRSVSEISDIVGYTSVNSFIRAFKREEGITPSQYRNMVLQNRLGGKIGKT